MRSLWRRKWVLAAAGAATAAVVLAAAFLQAQRLRQPRAWAPLTVSAAQLASGGARVGFYDLSEADRRALGLPSPIAATPDLAPPLSLPVPLKDGVTASLHTAWRSHSVSYSLSLAPDWASQGATLAERQAMARVAVRAAAGCGWSVSLFDRENVEVGHWQAAALHGVVDSVGLTWSVLSVGRASLEKQAYLAALSGGSWNLGWACAR